MSLQINVTTAVNAAMTWAHAQVTARIKHIEGALAGGAYNSVAHPSLQRYGDELRKELTDLNEHRDTLAEVLGRG